jgi:hypothetical protein
MVMLADACWLWTAARKSGGYGQLTRSGKRALVHRLIYELMVGPIPPEMQLDHLCRQRGCVNPAHLRICTNRENANAPGAKTGVRTGAKNRAKTHCPRGHEYTKENTYLDNGGRSCRACGRVSALARYHRKKEQL